MLFYLSAPYSSTDDAVKEERMRLFYKYDAYLSRNGHFTLSPLYKVETTKHGSMPDDWEYWKEYSYKLLSVCDEMIVMKMDGWEESTGVREEIEYCNEHGIDITYVEMSVGLLKDIE